MHFGKYAWNKSWMRRGCSRLNSRETGIFNNNLLKGNWEFIKMQYLCVHLISIVQNPKFIMTVHTWLFLRTGNLLEPGHSPSTSHLFLSLGLSIRHTNQMQSVLSFRDAGRWILLPFDKTTVTFQSAPFPKCTTCPLKVIWMPTKQSSFGSWKYLY